jgi:glutamate--cysteine ligase
MIAHKRIYAIKEYTDFILISDTTSFTQRVAFLYEHKRLGTLRETKHGIEREGLRVTPDGKLSQLSHPQALGSALTHESITTDFSESLLEFITPPCATIDTTLSQLADIHTHVYLQISDEQIWPLSMPCFVGDEDDIVLAHYGSSNIGKMKHVYRVGLKNRYGSMMQAISGVHFNFSLPKPFWDLWCEMHGQPLSQEAISESYFSLIRNYRRMCWMIPYLYGASPAICSSFLQGRKPAYDFGKLGKGTLYLPYATSLRMSDLGYTNSAQSALDICYNNLHGYVRSVRKAIRTPSQQYGDIPAGENGDYQQLNKNVLQIENELYSPIRPKQIAKSGEKPTDALSQRGVEYIEVRALDLDPYAATGVNKNQIYFLDVFLLYCLLKPSAPMSQPEMRQTEQNLTTVVLRGREPGLRLMDGADEVTLSKWSEIMFIEMSQVATLYDKANQTNAYTKAVELEYKKITDPDLTPSGMMLNTMIENDEDNSVFGKRLAEQHKAQLLARNYEHYKQADFDTMQQASIMKQHEIEESDTVDFSTFLNDYLTY